MSEPLTKEDFNQWKEDVFEPFVKNEFCHLRDKVDWIYKLLIVNLITVIVTLLGFLFTVVIK